MVKVRDDLPEDGALQINVSDWLNRYQPRFSQPEWETLKKAAELAQRTTHGITTNYFFPCFDAGQLTANVLTELNVDTETLAAALLYFPYRFGTLSREDIVKEVGESVAKLTEGVVQLSNEKRFSKNVLQHDKLRKMLLAVVDDVRVVLIKLAERLVALRSLRNTENEEVRQNIARVTRDIYAPLANRLGIGYIKWELEDYAFRYLESDAYKKIAKLLAERRLDRERYIVKIIGMVKQALLEEGIEAEVYGRAKHIYSIWRKMVRKGVDFQEIYDVRALRIIVKHVRDCYATLGILHALWQHVPKEFDDYIATPKENGYRSLHTAVIGLEGRVVEIQIRTPDMHDEAELGFAAHWLYKEGGKQSSDYNKKVATLRQILDNNRDIEDLDDSNEALREEVFSDRVYVLTPLGDIIDLPQDSTPIDFAYHVHTEVGHRCRGAKVNGAMVPLNYKLHSGEQVEILAAKTGHPSRDWLMPALGYVRSARAKAKINHWFHKNDDIKKQIEAKPSQERERKAITFESFPLKKQSNLSVRRSDVVIAGIGDLLCNFAKCCKPAPGDDILGYITLGRGVTVHRRDCSNIIKLPKESEARLIDIDWGQTPSNIYPVDIHIVSQDRQGLLSDVISILNQAKVNVLAVSTYTNKDNNLAHLALTLEIKAIDSLQDILSRIQNLPRVISAQRTQGSISVRKNKKNEH
jgi:GTP pyrophosphokinase